MTGPAFAVARAFAVTGLSAGPSPVGGDAAVVESDGLRGFRLSRAVAVDVPADIPGAVAAPAAETDSADAAESAGYGAAARAFVDGPGRRGVARRCTEPHVMHARTEHT